MVLMDHQCVDCIWNDSKNWGPRVSEQEDNINNKIHCHNVFVMVTGFLNKSTLIFLLILIYLNSGLVNLEKRDVFCSIDTLVTTV